MEKVKFNFRGGYPCYERRENKYFVKNLWCRVCNLKVEDYCIGMGILFKQGFYCNMCGFQIIDVKECEITKKVFMHKTSFIELTKVKIMKVKRSFRDG